MKTSDALSKFGAYLDYITRQQISFRSENGQVQPYPEQCPLLIYGELHTKFEDGTTSEMEFVKGRADGKSCLEIVFQAADGWFWMWSENNAENSWSASENEPFDELCQFLGDWEKEEEA